MRLECPRSIQPRLYRGTNATPLSIEGRVGYFTAARYLPRHTKTETTRGCSRMRRALCPGREDRYHKRNKGVLSSSPHDVSPLRLKGGIQPRPYVNRPYTRCICPSYSIPLAKNHLASISPKQISGIHRRKNAAPPRDTPTHTSPGLPGIPHYFASFVCPHTCHRARRGQSYLCHPLHGVATSDRVERHHRTPVHPNGTTGVIPPSRSRTTGSQTSRSATALASSA